MLFRPNNFQSLNCIDGDCLGRHLAVAVAGGYHYRVSSVCELGAGEGQGCFVGAVGVYGANACGICGESDICVWECIREIVHNASIAPHPCIGRTVTRPISKCDGLNIDQGYGGPVAGEGYSRHPKDPVGNTNILVGDRPKHHGILPVAAINGQRGRFPIGLSCSIITEQIIPRTPHQGDIINIIGRASP